MIGRQIKVWSLCGQTQQRAMDFTSKEMNKKMKGWMLKKRKRKTTTSVTGRTTYIVCSRLCGTMQLFLDGKFQNNPGPIYQYKTRSDCNSATHNIRYSDNSHSKYVKLSKILRKPPPSLASVQNANLSQRMPLTRRCFMKRFQAIHKILYKWHSLYKYQARSIY